MGYYNDIGFILKKGITLPKELKEKYFNEAEALVSKKCRVEFLLCVKWYGNFEEVKEIMNFMRPLIEDDKAAMIRIGEDWDDVEEEGNPDAFDVYCKKTITYQDIEYPKDVLCIVLNEDAKICKYPILKHFLEEATEIQDDNGVTVYHFHDFDSHYYKKAIGEISDFCESGESAFIRTYEDGSASCEGDIWELGLDFVRYVDVLENEVISPTHTHTITIDLNEMISCKDKKRKVELLVEHFTDGTNKGSLTFVLDRLSSDNVDDVFKKLCDVNTEVLKKYNSDYELIITNGEMLNICEKSKITEFEEQLDDIFNLLRYQPIQTTDKCSIEDDEFLFLILKK